MRKHHLYCILGCLAFFIAFNSCKFGDSKTDYRPNGIWESLGYGWVVEINDSTVRWYEICKVGCNLSDSSSRNDFDSSLEITYLKNDTLTIKSGITHYTFIRIPTLPSACNIIRDKQDPIYNFDVLWHTFNEHYCFFDIRNINWELTRQKYRFQLDELTSPLELYMLLEEMLKETNDKHVSIQLPDYLRDSYNNVKEEDNALDWTEIWQITNEYSVKMLEYYLDNYKSYNKGTIRWGRIRNEIGYIQINNMMLFSNYNVPSDIEIDEYVKEYLEYAGNSPNSKQDELLGIKNIMDSIIIDCGNVDAFIVDLRFNFGGKDKLAIEIINHFTNEKRIAFTKKAKFGDSYSPKQQIWLSPTDHNYLGKVFILTSPLTYSAAEIAVLSSMALPNVTRVGSATGGITSDILYKTLPNGWTYGLSNEIYESFEGTNYENRGIPPHIELGYDKEPKQFCNNLIHKKQNTDAALDSVLKILEGNY